MLSGEVLPLAGTLPWHVGAGAQGRSQRHPLFLRIHHHLAFGMYTPS